MLAWKGRKIHFIGENSSTNHQSVVSSSFQILVSPILVCNILCWIDETFLDTISEHGFLRIHVPKENPFHGYYNFRGLFKGCRKLAFKDPCLAMSEHPSANWLGTFNINSVNWHIKLNPFSWFIFCFLLCRV